MNVLIKKRKDSGQMLLVSLTSKKTIDEVNKFVNNGNYTEAILTTILKGRFHQEVTSKDLELVETNLILTETSVHREITRVEIY